MCVSRLWDDEWMKKYGVVRQKESYIVAAQAVDVMWKYCLVIQQSARNQHKFWLVSVEVYR